MNEIVIPDLPESISFEGFRFSEYYIDEQTILKPQLEAMELSDIRFLDGERDSFGPLTRIITAKDASGATIKFCYG